MSRFCIVGLGNPGAEYEKTPHNAGFNAVDEIAREQNADWKNATKFRAIIAKVKLRGNDIILVKPQTYMNLSGEAVARIAAYHEIPPQNIIVLSDDADLPAGKVRVRANGGNGGHRGLLSIIDCIGTKDFPRVRIGIGRDENGAGLIDYVLQRLSQEVEERIKQAITIAAKAAMTIIERGTNAAMNEFNGQQKA